MITKTERGELRTLIRQRFKLLRTDVKVREAELLAELQQRIDGRYAEHDQAWNAAQTRIQETVRAANRAINDELRAVNHDDAPPGPDFEYLMIRHLARPSYGPRLRLHANGRTQIEAQVRQALVALDRQESDLLTKLVADSLESQEARHFLAQIPTVADLVPADRLLELEQSLDGPSTT